MDPLIIALIVLVLAVIGGASVVASRSSGGWGGRVLRPRTSLAVVGGGRVLETNPRSGAGAAVPSDLPANPVGPVRTASLPLAGASPHPEVLGDASSAVTKLVDRLDRIEERLGGFERQVALHLDAAREESRAGRESIRSIIATADARQVAGLERLRSDIAGFLPGVGTATPDSGLWERRADAAMGVYAGVARLESSLAQVTNPILLPGEAYAPPVEFLPESLAWENWKDVGERAFSLADAISAQRLCFSDPTRQELTAFITTLRGALTRAIYPNLVPDPTPEQLDGLRSALGALAGELPRVRRALETEFRSLSGPVDSSSSHPDGPA